MTTRKLVCLGDMPYFNLESNFSMKNTLKKHLMAAHIFIFSPQRLKIGVYYLILCIGIGYILTNAAGFLAVIQAYPNRMIIIWSLALLQLGIYSLFLYLSMRIYQVRLSVLSALKLTVRSSFINVIAPFQGGLLYRGAVLKSIYQLPYRTFASLTLYTYGTLCLLYMWLLLPSYGLVLIQASSLWVWGVMLVTSVCFLAIIRLIYTYLYRHLKLGAFLTGKNFFLKPNLFNKLASLIIAVFTGKLIVSLLSLQQLYFLYGIELNLAELFFIQLSRQLASLFPLIPNGLGIVELVTILSNRLAQIESNQILNLAILDRLIIMVVVIASDILLEVFKCYRGKN